MTAQLRVPAPRRPRANPENVPGCSWRGHLPARQEAVPVEFVWPDAILEVRGFRELEVDPAAVQRFQHPRVADVRPGPDVGGRDAEGETPGQQLRSRHHRLHGEAVTLHHRVVQLEALPPPGG